MFVLNFISNILNIVLTLIELILSARFILIMFKVSLHAHQIVSWIYTNSAQLVKPFTGIFQQLKFAGFVIDVSTLLALIAYGLIGMLIVKLISHPTSYN